MSINGIKVNGDGQQAVTKRGRPPVKFIDVVQAAANVISTGTIQMALCPISQGVAVNQRIGDDAFIEKLFLNYSVDTQNADIFNMARIIVFQWHPNTTLLLPVVTDILQTATIYSMYDWQFSNQFTILYDTVHVMSGIATAPTVSGNQAHFGSVGCGQCKKRMLYAAGATNGSEQLFVLTISDSVIAPFPQFICTSRLTFRDE